MPHLNYEVYPSKALEMAKKAAISESFHLGVNSGSSSSKTISVRLVKKKRKVTKSGYVQKK